METGGRKVLVKTNHLGIDIEYIQVYYLIYICVRKC